MERAMCLFWERGYEKTSISDLTREIGISAPSLYAAFGDKRALFEEAVTRYQADPRSVTTAGLSGTDPREMLQIMFDRAAREYVSSEHPHGCLVNSEPALGQEQARNRAVTAEMVQGCMKGEVSGYDPETLAAFVHVVLVGMSSYARDGADEQQLRRVAELALRVVPD